MCLFIKYILCFLYNWKCKFLFLGVIRNRNNNINYCLMDEKIIVDEKYFESVGR